MKRQGARLVGGSIRTELDAVWAAIKERTLQPYGSQIVNRTTNGCSVHGGGISSGGPTGTSASFSIYSGDVSSVDYNPDGSIDKLHVGSLGVSGATGNAIVYPSSNLSAIPAGCTNLPSGTTPPEVYPAFDEVTIWVPAGASYTGDPFGYDLNVEGRAWHYLVNGCEFDPTLAGGSGAYKTTEHWLPCI